MLNLNALPLPVSEPVVIFAIILLTILIIPILTAALRFPSIIGLIIAGIMIGPHGANILIEDATVTLFRTIGLLYIMFLAGMEIDLDDFKKHRNRSIIFGIYTFSIPMIIGTLAGHYFLHLSWVSAILLASMFASHTLLAYPSARKLGIAQSEPVTITVGGTLITDTAALLVLAVIADYAKGNLTPDSWIKILVSSTVFIILTLLLIPRLGRWFLKKHEDDAGAKFLFVLAVIYTVAALSKLACLEPIIGAFLAGIAFNRLVPRTSPLMNRLQFFGDNFFIPFFLVSVGMLISLGNVFQGSRAVTVALTMTVTATACKWLAAFFTQKTFHYSRAERGVIFGLSNAQAAATLAAVIVGLNLGIFDENILNGTILMILVTCLVSSYAVEHAGRKLAIIESNKSPDVARAPERILVPIANPSSIHQLIDLSVMIKDPKSNEPIYPIVVVKDGPDVKTRIMESNKTLEDAMQHAAATDHSVHVVSRIDTHAASGILRAVKELMITDLVIGWFGDGYETEGIFGKVIDCVVAGSDETVIICRLTRPLAVTKRVLVLAPFLPDAGSSLLSWIRPVQALVRELSTAVIFYGSTSALSAIRQENQESLASDPGIYIPFIHWNNASLISTLASKNDLVIFVSSRTSSIPNTTEIQRIPRELALARNNINILTVYPGTYRESES